jgi:hypothetical protein
MPTALVTIALLWPWMVYDSQVPTQGAAELGTVRLSVGGEVAGTEEGSQGTEPCEPVGCEGTCERPQDIDDCAPCCMGPASCCVCCYVHYPRGNANLYCRAYCKDKHGWDCISVPEGS